MLEKRNFLVRQLNIKEVLKTVPSKAKQLLLADEGPSVEITCLNKFNDELDTARGWWAFELE